MFVKLSILTALVAPLVSALTVNAPTQSVTSAGQLTFTWTQSGGDPPFCTVFLANEAFNDIFAVANNVDTSLGTLTITIPAVPENRSYTVHITAIGNVTQVLGDSASFNIGPAVTPTSTSSTQTGISTGTVRTLTNTAVTTRVLPTTTSFGTVASNSAATTATSPNASGSARVSSTPSNSAALPVRFNMNVGTIASVVFSVVAGAAVIAL